MELTPNMTTRALVTAGALIVGGVIAYNSPRKSNHARNDSKDSPKKVQFKKDNVLIEKKRPVLSHLLNKNLLKNFLLGKLNQLVVKFNYTVQA